MQFYDQAVDTGLLLTIEKMYAQMKNIFLTSLLLLFTFSLFAQSFIKGKVVDALTGTPLTGASVRLGSRVTVSGKDGSFSIECNRATQLRVSFVGYAPAEQPITHCDAYVQVMLHSLNPYLSDVEITTTSSQNKSLLYQPVSISKLTGQELKRGTGLFLDDAININVPGVSMQRRTVSAGQQFNIRGYGNGSRGTRGISSNFDGQGYKVYLNGIPVTDAEGISLMDDIDFASIGDAEIIKGPAGTVYGLAIAGVVNLTSLKPTKGKTTAGQDVLIGNYGLQRYTTHFSTAGEHSSILMNYGYQQSNGFMEHTASRKIFANFIGEFQPSDKQTISTYFGYSNSYDERGGELTLTQYNNKDYSGNTDYIKRNGHSAITSFRAGISHTYHFSNTISNTTTLFGTGLSSNASSAGGWTDKSPINYGLRSVFATKLFMGKKISLSGITGIETQRQQANTLGYNMKQNPADTTTNGWRSGKPYWVTDALTSNVYTVTATTSVFTEWTLALPQDLFFTAGIGLSNMKISLDDRFNAATITKPSHFDTSYKNMFAPHLALNKVFSKQFSVYASYSTGYKAPVSSYFYITTPVVTNPPTPATARVNSVLKPETGKQLEIGTKGALLQGKLSYQLAAFRTVFSNKMTTVAVPLNNTTTAYSYMVNGGRQDDKGIEAFVRYTLLPSAHSFFTGIAPFVNFSYTDFKYKDFVYKTGSNTSNISTIDYSGLAVFGVPKVVTALGVDVTTRSGIYASLAYFYKDGMSIGYETSAAGNILRTATSYQLLNGKIGFRTNIGHHFDADAYFGIDNITGTQYPYMVFVNQLPDAYLPAPLKANYYGGIRVNYSF